MKRRIEITREHWTRVQLTQSGPAVCPRCLRPLTLAPVELAGLAALTKPQLEAALRKGGAGDLESFTGRANGVRRMRSRSAGDRRGA